jgi:hypothetical protein
LDACGADASKYRVDFVAKAAQCYASAAQISTLLAAFDSAYKARRAQDLSGFACPLSGDALQQKVDRLIGDLETNLQSATCK